MHLLIDDAISRQAIQAKLREVGIEHPEIHEISPSLSLGLPVATKAENQMQALQMSMTFIQPSVFFPGFIFPRETMPWIFYALGSVIPTTYFIALSRAIILRGAHFFEYWQNLAILIAMSIPFLCICALRFRKKIG
jgi:ABC-2 type transport system permease protein